jgi:hypothetical protein
MKSQSIQKLFAFIIATIMFSAIPAMVNAQKKCPDGNCPKGQICLNGYCVKSDCPLFCPPGYICINGGCRRNMPFLSDGSPIKEAVSISPANSNAISFQLIQSVTAKIYDATGRLVKTLANEKMQQGDHKIEWDRKDQAGKAVSAGIYILQVETRNKLETKKIIVTS